MSDILRLKCTEIGKLEALTALPRPSSWNKGDLLLREENVCRKGVEGRGGRGRRERARKKGKEKEGRGTKMEGGRIGREKEGREGEKRRREKRGKGDTRHTTHSLLPAPLRTISTYTTTNTVLESFGIQESIRQAWARAAEYCTCFFVVLRL